VKATSVNIFLTISWYFFNEKRKEF